MPESTYAGRWSTYKGTGLQGNPHYVEGHTSKADNPVWYRRGVHKNARGVWTYGPAMRQFLRQLDKQIAGA